MKGIAIVIMLFHHMYLSQDRFEGLNVVFTPFSADRIMYLCRTFKICVPIYAFISGYGLYLSYSLSSSTDSLKIEPYLISASENSEYVKVGMINAYKSVHWGGGIISNHQNSYLMFNERDLPQFALVTIYLQLPHYEYPAMLKGLYLCLDYNHNPIARRIVLVKQSDSTDVNEFLTMEGRLVPKAELTPELEVYYNYTCQEGDYIKTCTVPSPKLDATDLEREKKMLMI